MQIEPVLTRDEAYATDLHIDRVKIYSCYTEGTVAMSVTMEDEIVIEKSSSKRSSF